MTEREAKIPRPWDVGDTFPGDFVGIHAADFFSFKGNGAGAWGCNSHDGAADGGFTHTVAAEHGDDAALADLQGEVKQNMAFAVITIDTFHF